MKCSWWLRSGALAIGLLGIGPVHAAGDAAQGKIKAQQCMGCHGIPGYTNAYPNYHVPRVGGQEVDYLVSALKAYANGERQHKTMQAQAASLSEQDMQDIAAYFSAAGAK
tara:strand:- start:107 stop:436 length:330 start_codon:yes stop_codon:yes gene_type:complete